MHVLLLAHGFPPASSAGTELYVEQLASALVREGAQVTVLAREADPARPELGTREERREGVRILHFNNTHRTAATFEDTYDNPKVRAALLATLGDLAPDVVHAHHLTHLATGLVPELRLRGLPVFLTLHDYWLLCPRGQLLDRAWQRCPGPSARACTHCLSLAPETAALTRTAKSLWRRLAPRLPRNVEPPLRQGGERLLRGLSRAAVLARGLRPGRPPSADESPVRNRFARIHQTLEATTLLLAPSETVRRHFLASGVPEERIVHHPLGIDLRPFEHDISRPVAERAGRPLRLGFLGTLMVSKAPHLLLEAHRRLPPGAATVTLIGGYAPYHGDDRYRAMLAPLLEGPGVRHLGAQSHRDCLSFLAELDVLVVPSIWEENSPLVVREALLSGVAVVASDLGGLREQLVHGRTGLLFPPGDVRALTQALQRLLDEPALLETLCRARADGRVQLRTIEADARATLAYYRHGRPT